MIVAKNEKVQVDKLELGPFGVNAYVLRCRKTSESVLIDAPGEIDRILRALEDTYPKCILITHNHFDHVGGLSRLESTLKVPVAAHAADAGSLPVSADVLLNEGEALSLGAAWLEVLHTPGHTPGSVCFLTDNYLIAGDTLFPGGPGRTQSPASFRQIIESITQKIFNLPDGTQVYPGHGEATTVKAAKQLYQVFLSRPRNPELCGDVVWDESQRNGAS